MGEIVHLDDFRWRSIPELGVKWRIDPRSQGNAATAPTVAPPDAPSAADHLPAPPNISTPGHPALGA